MSQINETDTAHLSNGIKSFNEASQLLLFHISEGAFRQLFISLHNADRLSTPHKQDSY